MTARKGSIEIDWTMLGAELANMSSVEQAQFFTGFAHELGHYPSGTSVEMQLLAVRKEIPAKELCTIDKFFPCLIKEQ